MSYKETQLRVFVIYESSVLNYACEIRGLFLANVVRLLRDNCTKLALRVAERDVAISRSNQFSTTGVTKAVACAILSMAW